MATTIEYHHHLEIDAGEDVLAIAFTANGEHVVGGGENGVRVWRVEDGKQVATIPAKLTLCVAASNDGRWIAGGSWEIDEAARESVAGEVSIWDASTYKQVFVDEVKSTVILDVDFSPDSSRLVSAHSNYTAIIWDVARRQKVRTLDHDRPVLAAKYSPQGDGIATATPEFVRVWDSSDGRLLVDIEVGTQGIHSLLWWDNCLFVLTRDRAIKQIDAATGSTVSEWSVPDADSWWCIALPHHGKFVAYSAEHTIAFWDSATHSQLGLIQHTHNIRSIAYSSDHLLAIAGERKITIRDSSSVIFRSVLEPELDIDSAALNAWKRGQLEDAEALLSAAIPTSEHKHHVLACRALVRARLGLWDTALADVKESMEFRRSVIGYIAKCVALIGKGETRRGCAECNVASLQFAPDHHSLFLLVKTIVLFMAGKRVDAISCVDVSNTDGWVDPTLCVVQAYMHLLDGNKHMENKSYERAIQSFEDARIKLGNGTPQPPLIISLISGWIFDDLAITIQQSLCEALFAEDYTKEASEYVLRMANQEINMTEPIATWVSDFKCRCRIRLENLGDSALNARHYDDAILLYTAALSLGPITPQDLLVKRSNAWTGKGTRENALKDMKEWVRSMPTSDSWKDALAAAFGFTLERFSIYRALCEHLEAISHVTDAVACFRQMSSELAQDQDEDQENWTRNFESRCRGKLEDLGDGSMNAKQYAEAISHYTVALSLNPTTPRDLLVKRSNAWVGKGGRKYALNDAKEWARLMLASGSWKDALTAGVEFTLGKSAIYQALCERLETTGRITDAVACFHQMPSELAHGIRVEKTNWTHDFKSRCLDKLEDLGNGALNARRYDEAISQYTVALSLDPSSPRDLLVKRSKARANKGEWKDALNDADEVIKLDPTSPLGYERKHQALRGAGDYALAAGAFETMLSKMLESPNRRTRERSRNYVRPEATQKVIRTTIEKAIRNSPPVLVNTHSGRLCNKSEQSAAFESMPIFTELICSMTTRINHTLIEEEVGKFYRYATFSHTWEGENEPRYEKVIEIVVYNLEASPTHNKLQMFCKIVRDDGFHWAWSDTCCIDKRDHLVLQEALVRMFKWYEGSAVTIIFLCDVEELHELDALMRSRWNSRGWTLQEYHASKVVRIYTKDWTPYMGLTIDNHKDSPEIISQMEKAMEISAQALKALRPGLDDIRVKLRLASERQTTRVEDAAYSLFGIFSVSFPVTYGEGDKALGRLLSQLLMSSGDTSILAWMGVSGSFNSCLPSDIAVFSQPLTAHIPPAIPDAELETIIAALHTSPLDVDLVRRLYNQMTRLHIPSFGGQRMRLPCLAFNVRLVSRRRAGLEFVFHTQVDVLGAVDIKTKQIFSLQDSLYLVHPWIDFLLGRRASRKRVETIPHENKTPELDDFVSFDSFPDHSSTSHANSLNTASHLLSTDAQSAYEFLARLQQPFGALLLASNPPNVEYRRVSTESLITVQVKEITSLTLDQLIQSARELDVL